MSLSTEETDALLERMGQIIYTNTCQDSVGFILYGIYLVLFTICLRMTLARPLGTKAAQILLGVVLLLFLSTTTQFVTDMMGIVTQVLTYFVRSQVPLEDRRARWTNQFLSLKIIGAWPVLINFMISDAVVVWRAWVMYPNNIIVKISLGIITVADTILWFYSQGLASAHADGSGDPDVDRKLATASNFISLGTNLLGTGLIALQAWDLHRHTDKARRGEVGRALLVLVETGAIFAVVQLVNSVLGEISMVTHSPLGLATRVIGKSAIYIAAILPTATIIIIRSNHSIETSWSLNSMPDSSPMTLTKLSTLEFDRKIETRLANPSPREVPDDSSDSETGQSSNDRIQPSGLTNENWFKEKSAPPGDIV